MSLQQKNYIHIFCGVYERKLFLYCAICYISTYTPNKPASVLSEWNELYEWNEDIENISTISMGIFINLQFTFIILMSLWMVKGCAEYYTIKCKIIFYPFSFYFTQVFYIICRIHICMYVRQQLIEICFSSYSITFCCGCCCIGFCPYICFYLLVSYEIYRQLSVFLTLHFQGYHLNLYTYTSAMIIWVYNFSRITNKQLHCHMLPPGVVYLLCYRSGRKKMKLR